MAVLLYCIHEFRDISIITSSKIGGPKGNKPRGLQHSIIPTMVEGRYGSIRLGIIVPTEPGNTKYRPDRIIAWSLDFVKQPFGKYLISSDYTKDTKKHWKALRQSKQAFHRAIIINTHCYRKREASFLIQNIFSNPVLIAKCHYQTSHWNFAILVTWCIKINIWHI